MMKGFYFKNGHVVYFIPKIAPGEEALWDIYYSPQDKKNAWHASNIQHSVLARMRFCRRIPERMQQLYKRIKAIEGKGSKMAFKILGDHPCDPIIVLGIDAETKELFDANYAENEMQRLAISHAHDALEKLHESELFPEILQYEVRNNYSFIKTARAEGVKIGENELNEDLVNYFVSMAQFSMNQYREESSMGLIPSLSNGSFAPWNVLKSSDGNYHMLQWQHVADRPLGYDLIYYLGKLYMEHGTADFQKNIEEQLKWVEYFYSMFGIEDYTQYFDTNARLYAAQLESEARYVEANKVRLLSRMVLAHYYEKHGTPENDLLSRPKILFIMHMPPPVHGASMVGKWIHESEYINSKFDCYYLNLTAAANIADVGKVRLSKIIWLFRLIGTIKRLLKAINPELVYMTPNTGGIPFIKDSIVVNSVKRMGFSVLAHFHNKGVSQFEKNPFFSRMYRKFFDSLKVLLIVPSLYDDNKTYLRIRDVYVCPNGTPLTLEQEIKAERHHEVPEILFLSNMILSKGVLDLLDALYLLRGQGKRFHCTMIGAETPELSRKRIEDEIDSRHLSEYVDYIGPRYGTEKDKYLAKSDIMAFPTYYPKECFPLVILEAMEYKIPVVSTYEAGIPYSVVNGKTGLLCKSQNPIDLSEKLIELIDNPTLRWKMGEEGYKLRNKKFNLDMFEKNFSEVLNRALNDIKTTNKK